MTTQSAEFKLLKGRYSITVGISSSNAFGIGNLFFFKDTEIRDLRVGQRTATFLMQDSDARFISQHLNLFVVDHLGYIFINTPGECIAFQKISVRSWVFEHQ